MSTFVEVPAALIREKLKAAGFKLASPERGSHEETWIRSHDRNPRYVIKVYTSLTAGAQSTRDCGTDAIRVVALEAAYDQTRWPGRWFPIFKGRRVHRTGSPEAVVDRMMDRAREAYAAINEHLKQRGRPYPQNKGAKS
jgi:hypothetical protein